MPNEFFASDNFAEYARKSQNGKLLQQGNEMNVLQSQKKMPCVSLKSTLNLCIVYGKLFSHSLGEP